MLTSIDLAVEQCFYFFAKQTAFLRGFTSYFDKLGVRGAS